MRRARTVWFLLAVSLAVHSQLCQGDSYEYMVGDDDGFGTGTPLMPGDLLFADWPWGPGDAGGFDLSLWGRDGGPDFSWGHTFDAFSLITTATLFVQYVDFPESGSPEQGAGQLWIDGMKVSMWFPMVPQESGPWTVHGMTFDLAGYLPTLLDGEVTFGIDIWPDDGYSIDYAILTIEGKVIPVAIPAVASLDPATVNLKSSGQPITCYIGLPDGYDVHDIDVDSIHLEGILDVQHSDIQDDVLMVKFGREALTAYLEAVLDVTPPADVDLTVSGELSDGTRFSGGDTIRVTSPASEAN